jgi:ATP-dependent RNA helicase DeaD
MSQTFKELGLNDALLSAVKEAGFVTPSPIQAQAIPHIIAGKDVVGQAHTGTGKTAAFSLPILQQLEGGVGVEALIITPTRELAGQVSDEIYRYGRKMGVRTVTVYGGRSAGSQINQIKKGAQFVIATPGRLLDLLSSGKLENFNPKFVVLDEADEMLDMGFLDDIHQIFTFLPTNRQTLLFSATMPGPIKTLMNQFMFEPINISVVDSSHSTNDDIEQQYYIIEDRERDDAIIRLLDAHDAGKSILFCRMKREVDRIKTFLNTQGYQAEGLHGDMEQNERETVMKAFKGGSATILVATDVAARGIHVNDISHVFNYHIPFDPESYVHRIGRTGRAGQKGTAVTLVSPLEFKELQKIKKHTNTPMKQYLLPSKKNVLESKRSKLMDTIKHQHLDEASEALISELKEDFDSETIALKLISYILEKDNSVKGPETIGIQGERLKTLLNNLNKKHDGRSRGGNNRGRGNNRNRGGGNNRRNNNRNRRPRQNQS